MFNSFSVIYCFQCDIVKSLDVFLCSNYFVLGLTDLEIEGTFVWNTDFSVLDYTNWDYGQPNGYYSQDCVITCYSEDKWCDTGCTHNYNDYEEKYIRALCEKLP